MKAKLALTLILTASCAKNGGKEDETTKEAAPPVQTAALSSGLDKKGFDVSVRPQDDLFAHVNGTWMKETAIPADKADYGMFTRLSDDARDNIKKIIEEVSAGGAQ